MIPLIAIPIALKIASAIANHYSNKNYEKKSRRAANNDALVAALSRGQVQSDSAPDFHPSKLGAGLGVAGDVAGLYVALGGKWPFGAKTPSVETGAMSPGGDLSAGDPSEMSGAYGQSRTHIGGFTGPRESQSPSFTPQESKMPSTYGPSVPENYQDPRRILPGQQFINPEWQNQRSDYGPYSPPNVRSSQSTPANLYDGMNKRRNLSRFFGSLS